MGGDAYVHAVEGRSVEVTVERAGDLRARVVAPWETDPDVLAFRQSGSVTFEPRQSRARISLLISDDHRVDGTRETTITFGAGSGEGNWVAGSPIQAVVRVTDDDLRARLLKPRRSLTLRHVLESHRLTVGFACSQKCTLLAVLHGAGRHLATAETRPHFSRRGRIRFELDRAALSDLRAAAGKAGVRVVLGASFIGPNGGRKAKLPLRLIR